MRVRVLVFLVLTPGCVFDLDPLRGRADGGLQADGGSANPDAPDLFEDAPDVPDAGTETDSGTVVLTDAPVTLDAGSDAFVPDAGSDAGRVGIDPALSTPPSTGTQCIAPGFTSTCAAGETCRIYDPMTYRCETYSTAGVRDAPCSSGRDCDAPFGCFEGRCTTFCRLGTNDCGFVFEYECVDVGHPGYGVCRAL